jgi:hypothetical protein
MGWDVLWTVAVGTGMRLACALRKANTGEHTDAFNVQEHALIER